MYRTVEEAERRELGSKGEAPCEKTDTSASHLISDVNP